MTSVVVPIDETSSTIILPVIKSIVEEYIFSSQTGQIKDIIYTQRTGKNIQRKKNAPNQPLRLQSDEYILVEYTINPNEERFDNSKYDQDYLPIFKNPDLGISITPMHAYKSIEMTVTYRSKNYDELLKWINKYTRDFMRAAPCNLHSVLYNITIPDNVYKYLYDSWSLSETKGGYGLPFKGFVKNGFGTGVGIRLNSNDTAEILITSIKNSNVLGMYTSPPPGNPTPILEPPSSEITFTYTVNFDYPTALLLDYQLVIHNQLLDIKYLYQYADRNLYDNPMAGNNIGSNSVILKTMNPHNFITYPDRMVNETDGWNPPVIPFGYKMNYLLPIQVDELNLTNVINLSDLLEIGFPQVMVDLFIQNPIVPFIVNKWFYFISLYEVNAKTNVKTLQLTPQGEIVTTTAMDIRSRYYFVISKNFKLGSVDLSLLRKNPNLLNSIFQIYDNGLNVTTIGNGSYVITQSLIDNLNKIQALLHNPMDLQDYYVYKTYTIANLGDTAVRLEPLK
jgi:hypothetical protein